MGALDGVRVVELGHDVAAPLCSRLLADLGADVVKVEPPTGDPTRSAGPWPGSGAGPDNSALFHYLNAGKRGHVADLDREADRAWLDRSLAEADVLVENLDPAARRRWQLDFDSLAEAHPHLVAVSLSPYGRSGPWADRPGTDLCAQAASSLVLGLGSADHSPLRIPFDQADHQAALHGAAAALCALREQRRSGLGQGVDIATAQVMGYMVGGMYLVSAKNGNPWQRKGTLMSGAPYPTGFFRCGDGFVCIASQTPKQWEAFLALMDNPKWAKEDEHASNAIYLGLVDAKPAHGHFQEWLAKYTRAELLEMAAAEGIVMGVAQTVDEVLESPQYEYRDLWVELPVGDATVRVPKPGYQLTASPTSVRGPGPALGSASTPGDADAFAAVRDTRPAPTDDTTTDDTTTARALEGVRVLEFGWNWAGPMAGQLLADMGADVIRVETSKRQDLMRFLDYTSFFFCHNNRSKRSITVNVTTPQGAQIVRDLAATADIVLDNFAAGVMTKNGLGYDDLRQANPGIIVVSMSMAGQQGPLRGMRGFASIATGYSGMELLVGYPDEGVSTGLLPFGLGDTTNAVQATIGALAALEHRRRTGEGQFVDVSQIDSSVATLGQPLLDYQLGGIVAGPQGNTHPHLFPHGLYAADGEDRWVAVAVRDHADWQALCGVLGRDDWAGDASLDGADGRRARAAEIDAALSAWVAARDRDAAADQLAAAGVAAAPVLELTERDQHPQFTERGFRLHHDGDGFDPCDIYATPWLLTRTPPALTRPTPLLGQDNDDVFGELLGLSPAQRDELVAQGVLV